MKIWLDDEFDSRKSWFPEGEGWIHCRWPEEVIAHLKTGEVKIVSLDHDLGEGSEYEHPRTGYDVVVWLENEIGFERWSYSLPEIRIHSANSEGRRRMAAGVKNLRRLFEQRRTE